MLQSTPSGVSLKAAIMSSAHRRYNFFGPKCNLNIFRFEDSVNRRALSSAPAGNRNQTADGHTMIDGPTEVSDLDRSVPIRRLCSASWTTFSQAVARPFPVAPTESHIYRYNPWVADTIPGLIAGFTALAAKRRDCVYKRITCPSTSEVILIRVVMRAGW